MDGVLALEVPSGPIFRWRDAERQRELSGSAPYNVNSHAVWSLPDGTCNFGAAGAVDENPNLVDSLTTPLTYARPVIFSRFLPACSCFIYSMCFPGTILRFTVASIA